MHIALLTPHWPAARDVNGIATYVEALRAGLLAQGHRVTVLAHTVDEANGDRDVHRIRAPLSLRLRNRIERLLGKQIHDTFSHGQVIASALNAVHRHDPIDVIEMEETFGWCADVLRLVPAPLVVKLHGPGFLDLVDEARDTEFARLRMANEERALRQMPVIVSPSHSTLSLTIAHYGLNPLIAEVVPNPVTNLDGLPAWDLRGCDRRRLLFVGRFDKRKGGDIALLAFKRLLNADGQLTLTFAGPDRGLRQPDGTLLPFDAFRDGHFSPDQRRQIRYLGQVPRGEIASLRLGSLLTLVTSRWENQPNTVLEAMAQGCPIVALDCGGMRELITHGTTGLLARPDDLGDLCVKLQQVLNAPDAAAQMGANARRHVVRHFSAESIAQRTADVYRRAIEVATRSGTRVAKAARSPMRLDS